jgi:hypothetical protein
MQNAHQANKARQSHTNTNFKKAYYVKGKKKK